MNSCGEAPDELERGQAAALRQWVGALALGLLLLLALKARAEDATTAPSSALRDALQAYAEGDLVAAQRGFEQAHAEQPTARTLRGLGVVAYRQSRWLDAYAYLTLSLVSTAKPLTEELHARVLTLVEEIGAKLTRVHFQLSPGDAALRIDGSPPSYDASGAVLMLPGTHRVTLEAPGHVASVWVLDVQAGSEQLRSWQLALESVPLPDPSRGSSQTAAAARSPLDAHRSPRAAASRAVTLRHWGYGSLAGAAAGLVVMSVGLGLGLDRMREIEDLCRHQPGERCTEATADAASRAARLDLLSGLTISGGVLVVGVGAAASTSLFVTARRTETTTGHDRVGVSVGLRGTF